MSMWGIISVDLVSFEKRRHTNSNTVTKAKSIPAENEYIEKTANSADAITSLLLKPWREAKNTARNPNSKKK